MFSQLKQEVVKLNGKSVIRHTYTGYISKNRAEGLKQIKQANKIVHLLTFVSAEFCLHIAI